MNVIRIYLYNKSKIRFIQHIASHFFDNHCKGNYYITNDWIDGPHLKIVLKHALSEEIHSKLVEEVKKWITFHPIDSKEESMQKSLYLKSQNDLMQLEGRSSDKAVQMKNHGSIVVDQHELEGRYNSEFHFQQFQTYRYELQDVHNQVLNLLIDQSSEERMKLFVNMFFHIASLYKEGVTRGYLSFVSHAQGFFSMGRSRGYQLEQKFEHKYQVYKQKIEAALNDQSRNKVTNQWKRNWEEISQSINECFRIEDFRQEGFMDIERQFQMFKNHSSELDNAFHQKLLKMKDLESLINSEEMIIYRNIVNLFYLTLPLFEVGFIEKHLYCYMTYRYVEDHYDPASLISWKSVEGIQVD